MVVCKLPILSMGVHVDMQKSPPAGNITSEEEPLFSLHDITVPESCRSYTFPKSLISPGYCRSDAEKSRCQDGKSVGKADSGEVHPSMDILRYTHFKDRTMPKFCSCFGGF
jgi:hypothetical protein